MKIYLLLLSVLLISGCVGIGDIFGGDVISVQQNVINNGKNDVIIMKDAITLPTPPLLPDQDVALSFILENQDTLKSARSVIINLFNAPTFKDENGQLCNSRANGCTPDRDECSINQPCNILPGEQKPINFYMISPSESEIAGIKTSVSMDYLVNYNFDSSLVYTLPVIDKAEVLKRQRSGEKINLAESKSHSSGPMQIDVSLQGAPYVLAGQDAVMLFTLNNKGSGSIKNSEILGYQSQESTGLASFCTSPNECGAGQICQFFGSRTCLLSQRTCSSNSDCLGGADVCSGATGVCSSSQYGNGLVITFPAEFELPEYESGRQPDNSIFMCTHQAEGNWVCQNTQPIPIYKDQSRVSMRFKVRVPAQQLAGAPFRSYTIMASLGYTYELRNSLSVAVNPFQNV